MLKCSIPSLQPTAALNHTPPCPRPQVEGRIPADLSGTLLRNGPGLFEVGSKRVAQPFDGDGLVCSFAFQDGHAFFRSRYVRTEGFVAEQRAQAPLYRSAFNKGLPEGTWCGAWRCASHWGGH